MLKLQIWLTETRQGGESIIDLSAATVWRIRLFRWYHLASFTVRVESNFGEKLHNTQNTLIQLPQKLITPPSDSPSV